MIGNLEIYHTWLLNANNNYEFRPETPTHFNFKTLWIPIYSGNRIAALDLNHEINPNFSIPLIGNNGNCYTPYQIIEVPKYFTEDHLYKLTQNVAIALNKSINYPIYRVLKADERMPTILNELQKLINNEITKTNHRKD